MTYVAVDCIDFNHWGKHKRRMAITNRKTTSSNRAPSTSSLFASTSHHIHLSIRIATIVTRDHPSSSCTARLHNYHKGRINHVLSFVVTTITMTCYSWENIQRWPFIHMWRHLPAATRNNYARRECSRQPSRLGRNERNVKDKPQT